MTENKITEAIKVVGGQDADEPPAASPATTVVLDASTPPVRSIVRVVLITLLLLSAASFIESIFSALTHLFFLIVLSVFFAYLIEPLVQLIMRPFAVPPSRNKYMPRLAAIALAFVIVLSVIGGTVAVLTPTVAEQAKQLASNAPTYLASVQTRFREYGTRYQRYKVPENVQETINEKLTAIVTTVGESVTSLLISLVYYIPWLILIPILAFFFLKDANLFRVSLLRLIPSGDVRSRVEMVLHDVNKTLAAYARAQLISCVLIGTLCTIAFYVLGLNYAILLGVLAAIFEFVPLIGPLILALIVITVAALTSFAEALSVGLFLGVLRILQDYIFYPRIVREGIHLHPLAIILSVLAGEQIAGIPGVFLSIPIIALLTVAYKHILEHRNNHGVVAKGLAPKDLSGEI